MTQRVAPLAVAGATIALGFNILFLAVILTDIEFDGSAVGKVSWKTDLLPPGRSAPDRKPVEAYKGILERPVFFKTRLPFVPAPAPRTVARTAAPAKIADANLVLGGVMIERNVKRAYLFSRGNTSGVWVGEGEEFTTC